VHTETHAKNLFRVQTLNNTDATGITPKCVLYLIYVKGDIMDISKGYFDGFNH